MSPGGHLIDVSAELKDGQQERIGCRRICPQGIHQTLEGDQDLHTREQPSAAAVHLSDPGPQESCCFVLPPVECWRSLPMPKQ